MAEDMQHKENNEMDQASEEPRECVDTPAKKKAAVVVGCLIIVVLGVEIIAPINADGSMFEAPEPFKAVVKASGIAEVAKKMAFVPAREANGAASDAASKVAQAMDMNDGTIAENAAEVAAKNAAVAS